MPLFGVRSTSFLQWGIELANGKRLACERFIYDLRSRDTSKIIDWSKPQKVLEVGSGRLRPQVQLLARSGNRVTGIDLANNDSMSAKEIAYRLARTILGSQIQLSSSKKKAGGSSQLVEANAETLPFPDGTFDIATSVAAFEHFLNPEKVVAELHRVLRPGGALWLWIHNFTALSGGHTVGNTFPPTKNIPAGIEPWDHLRKRREPITVPLNEWRMSQYAECIADRFEIERTYVPVQEGEEYLTPEIAADLSEYSREELLAAAFVIVAHKR